MNAYYPPDGWRPAHLREAFDRTPMSRGTHRRSKERADRLVCEATENTKSTEVTSIAYLNFRISRSFCSAKDTWRADLKYHGTEEIPPPPSKNSCLDRTSWPTRRLESKRASEVNRVPRAYHEEDRRQVLVLQRTAAHVKIASSPLLSACGAGLGGNRGLGGA